MDANEYYLGQHLRKLAEEDRREASIEGMFTAFYKAVDFVLPGKAGAICPAAQPISVSTSKV